MCSNKQTTSKLCSEKTTVATSLSNTVEQMHMDDCGWDPPAATAEECLPTSSATCSVYLRATVLVIQSLSYSCYSAASFEIFFFFFNRICSRELRCDLRQIRGARQKKQKKTILSVYAIIHFLSVNIVEGGRGKLREARVSKFSAGCQMSLREMWSCIRIRS